MNMNYSLNGIIGAAHTNERTHTIWRVEFFGINFQSADGMKYEYLLSSRVTYSSGKRERPYMCVCGSVTGPTACFMSYTCAVKCVKCILISIETLCVLLEFQMDFFRARNGFAYTAASSHLMCLERHHRTQSSTGAAFVKHRMNS